METALHETFTQKTGKKVKQYVETNPKDAKLTLTFFTVSFIALFIGGTLGLLQGLERAGLLTMPAWFDYYQTLTTHGILLILIFTGTVLVGYVYAGVSHVLGGLLPKVRKMGWIAFGLMVAGTVLTASQVIIGEASVLYTFYPPMAASPWFYIGLVLVVLGIWSAAFGAFINVDRKSTRLNSSHVAISYA